MPGRISLALVLHNHQPVGNFGWVIADVYEHAYEPLIAGLERHPAIRLGLHYTGPLLDWLAVERPTFLVRLRRLVDAGRIELLGGGYYEPVLASLPERDRLAQLRRMGDAIERIGGRRPTGAWLAERVWEPDLPVSLVDGGYRWTILDDAHFRAAAVDESNLWGSYSTDDQGRLLTVFGSDKELRYRIPFGDVGDTIAYLRRSASADRHLLAVMGDDGEKFGAWPGTYEHCWGEGAWVDRFFTALAAERDWISLVTPSEWIEREPPLGRVYLPTSSYAEMGEWALPPDEALAFEHALARAQAENRPEARWLRGGFWRNFQVKYREINDLHKQMLRVSDKVDRMPAGPAREAALGELLQGQSNDCYWHGVFGGIYIAHMRLATYEHLIAAEDLADGASRAAGGSPDGIGSVDTDLDGIDELLVTSPGQVVVIDTVEGGGIGSWDIRAVQHALTAVMRRRPEAYHARLLESASPTPVADPSDAADGDAGSSAVASIHAIVRSREPGLADRLQYDGYERRSGLVHLFAPGTTRDAFARAEAVELGDAHTGAYEVVELAAENIRLARDVYLTDGQVVHVDKRFVFDGDRRAPNVGLEVSVENRSGSSVRFDLGVEWALMLLGGGGNPAAYYEVGEPLERHAHDSSGQVAATTVVASGNTFVGIGIVSSFDPPATAWWTPIETVSNSEYGFERIYQGSALVSVWPVELAPGERRTVRVAQLVSTDRDRGVPA